jgi:hypothetical protein
MLCSRPSLNSNIFLCVSLDTRQLNKNYKELTEYIYFSYISLTFFYRIKFRLIWLKDFTRIMTNFKIQMMIMFDRDIYKLSIKRLFDKRKLANYSPKTSLRNRVKRVGIILVFLFHYYIF